VALGLYTVLHPSVRRKSRDDAASQDEELAMRNELP
jgi:hypothetical protein